MPSRIRTSRLISSHIKRCHLLFASYGHIAGDSHGMCWSVNDRSSGHSGRALGDTTRNGMNFWHPLTMWRIAIDRLKKMNHVTFQTFPDGLRFDYLADQELGSHDHLQEIGAQSPEHIAVSGPAFGKSHDHQGNRRRNHALPTQFLVCKFAPETKTDRSSVVSPSRVNLLHHAPRSKLCESNQVLRLY